MERLTEQGITVAWAHDLAWQALWLPEERVMVLSADEPPALAEEIAALLDADRGRHGERSSAGPSRPVGAA